MRRPGGATAPGVKGARLRIDCGIAQVSALRRT